MLIKPVFNPLVNGNSGKGNHRSPSSPKGDLDKSPTEVICDNTANALQETLGKIEVKNCQEMELLGALMTRMYKNNLPTDIAERFSENPDIKNEFDDYANTAEEAVDGVPDKDDLDALACDMLDFSTDGLNSNFTERKAISTAVDSLARANPSLVEEEVVSVFEALAPLVTGCTSTNDAQCANANIAKEVLAEMDAKGLKPTNELLSFNQDSYMTDGDMQTLWNGLGGGTNPRTVNGKTVSFTPASGQNEAFLRVGGGECDNAVFELALAVEKLLADNSLGTFAELEAMVNALPAVDIVPAGWASAWSTQQQMAKEIQVLTLLHPDWTKWKVYYEGIKNVLSGQIHFVLDVFGLVPGIGEAADLINGGIYVLEGDGLNATLSFASMLPVAGWTGTAAKWAKSALTVTDAAKNTFKSGKGIIYASRKYADSNGNIHALNHIYEHFKDNIKRDIHSIFTIPTNELVGLIDDAWDLKVKNNIAPVIQNNGNYVYTIPVSRIIGKEGGEFGSQEGLTKLFLVFDGNSKNIITAYPVK